MSTIHRLHLLHWADRRQTVKSTSVRPDAEAGDLAA